MDKSKQQGHRKSNTLMMLEKFSALIPTPLYWEDRNSVILGANNHVLQGAGITSLDQYVGKTLYELYPKEMADHIKQHNEEVMRTGKTLSQEESIKDISSGRIKYFIAVKSPLYDDDGSIIGVIGTSIDITEQKRLEAIKDDFISNMQHDIRTPFAGIGAIADLFCTTYSSKYPEIKNFSQIQRESCLQWEKIQIELLKAIDTKQAINFEKFYLQDKIDEIKELLHAIAEVRHLALVLECQSREETGEITSDKLKIGLILQSLVSNALNFTEKGSVTIRMRKNKSFFVIDIIDTGIGIPEDKFDYIFEKFSKLYRSNKYGNNFKGLGLGLYSCRRDARKIGAKISIKSIEGVGSTFTLILPASFNVSI